MRITVLQPESYVPLDRFGSWLRAGAELEVVLLEEQAPPSLEEVGDALVVLGGRMDSCDDTRSPWLPAVRALLRDAVAAEKPTLGICLGHQILATALGGEVAVGIEEMAEEGAFRISWSDDALTDPLVGALAADGVGLVAESHHDAVTRLPARAVLLASSERCPVQAFRVGSAVGVQFHPEASPERMARWTAGHGGDGDAMLDEMRAADEQVARLGEGLATAFLDVVRRSLRPGLPAVGA